ncbi:STAS domain-containing protein [Priestia koreensis]|uniref:STAS domain-containing protein n=1 Tax=Priestia koreensis TaxID=284581 RepID=UPI00203DBCF8|nr:STAS domain-containing protein [Priestia koreensis]MCM3005431.1 STAS domain-containing protein [Priestia koreensis]
MSDYMIRISKKILEQKEELAQKITDEQNKRYPDQLLPMAESFYPLRVELVTLYANALVLTEDERTRQVEEWGLQSGRQCAEMNATLDAMLNEVPQYRRFIGEVVQEEGIHLNLSLPQFYHAISLLDRTVNEVVYYFSLPFVNFHSEQIEQSRNAMMELSVPVVPIVEGVAVLPVVGTIDTYRAKLLLEHALEQSVQLKLSYFVLDLSGVPIIDTYVAQQLFQIIDSLKLIGVDAMVSGITPDIAQTVVNLGINFGQTKTFSSLQQALGNIGLNFQSVQ